MIIKEKIYIFDDYISTKNKKYMNGLFSFLNNEKTQSTIFKNLNENIIIYIESKSKHHPHKLKNKCISISKQHHKNCKKIIFNKKKIYFNAESHKSTFFIIFSLVVNLIFSLIMSHSLEQIKYYQKRINRNNILLKKTKTKIYLKQKNKTKMINQLNVMQNLLKAPIILKKISINNNSITIFTASKKTHVIERFYENLNRKNNLKINIKELQDSSILIEAKAI